MTDNLTVDNLPLEVREHLMRGQYNAATTVLVETHQLSKSEAEQLIEDYRQQLRERKIALDIQIMHQQQEKEAREQYHFWWRWGVRIALVVAVLFLLYLMAGSIK